MVFQPQIKHHSDPKFHKCPLGKDQRYHHQKKEKVERPSAITPRGKAWELVTLQVDPCQYEIVQLS